MRLSPGHQLGPYEILAPIGEGGMGEVYRARDTRLGRTVAIKLAKAEFTERFEREARAVAQLNHPNICQLYDVGPNYLVMEFIDGVSLKGPLPLEKAISYGTQILDALAAAHRKRITHRDLKPGNIMVTAQGIKLLDFGLAKLDTPLAPTDDTVAATRTTEGLIVGTLQYMSPEQLQAKPVDARSDIFSFGCILYELLTGRRAFQGESTASVIAAILERDPEPAQQASPLERILKTCLAKDPDQRFQDALDLKRSLLWAVEPATPGPQASRRSIPMWAGALIAASAVAAGALWFFPRNRETPPPRLTRLTRDGSSFYPALSPDGKLIAFSSSRADGNTDIYIQQPDGVVPVQITDDPAVDVAPQFTADGTKILFTSYREPQGIYVVSALGGETRLLIPDASRAMPSPSGKHVAYTRRGFLMVDTLPPSKPIELTRYPERGYVWSPDGSELFANDMGYFRITPDGKTRQPVELEKNLRSRDMHVVFNTQPIRWLASGELLYSARFGDAVNLWRIPIREASHAAPVPVSIGTSFNLMQASSAADKVVFTDNGGYGALWRLPCDLNTGKVNGELQPIVSDKSDGGHPSIHSDGSALVYTSRKAGMQSLFFRDLRTGKERIVATPLRSGDAISHARLSPDGKLIAAAYSSLEERGSAYNWKLVTVPVSGGDLKTIDPQGTRIRGWTPDGKLLLLWSANPPTRILTLDLATGKRTDLFPFVEQDSFSQPSLSSDGKWIAFEGPPGKALYIAPFHGAAPIPKSEWIPVAESGSFPAWSPDGNQIYYALTALREGMASESQTTMVRRPLDPLSKRPVSAAVPFYQFTGGVLGNPVVNPIAVARDQIVVVFSVSDSDIWAMNLSTP